VGAQVVIATAHSKAPPEAVWPLLADSATWPEWGPWDEHSLDREGAPAPHGIGALRTLTTGRVSVKEEITAFEPPRLLAYRLLSGLPVKDYKAEVMLSAEEGGTKIRWWAEFKPTVPGTGWLIRRRLQTVFDDVTERLASAGNG
jgi:uncharacterized protein YndB with AHSA1/START domain